MRRSNGDRNVTRFGTGPSSASGCACHSPFSYLTPSERERFSSSCRSGFGPGDALCFRIPAFGQVPESLLALAADDGDDAAALEHLEHQADLAAPPPVVRVPGHHQVGLDLARGQWPTRFELAQQVPLEARVRPQELGPLLLVLVLPRRRRMRARMSGKSSIGQMNALHSKSLRSFHSRRSSSPGS